MRKILMMLMLIAAVYCVYAQDAFEVSPMIVGFGYSPNIPNELGGFCLYTLNKGKVGFYGDVKTSLPMIDEDRDDFYKRISIITAEEIFEDKLIDKKTSYTSFNLGPTILISNHIALYCAIGVTYENHYRRYKDEYEILGDEGRYWIEDKSKDSMGANLSAGIILKYNERVRFQLGAESYPAGITAGISITGIYKKR